MLSAPDESSSVVGYQDPYIDIPHVQLCIKTCYYTCVLRISIPHRFSVVIMIEFMPAIIITML